METSSTTGTIGTAEVTLGIGYVLIERGASLFNDYPTGFSIAVSRIRRYWKSLEGRIVKNVDDSVPISWITTDCGNNCEYMYNWTDKHFEPRFYDGSRRLSTYNTLVTMGTKVFEIYNEINNYLILHITPNEHSFRIGRKIVDVVGAVKFVKFGPGKQEVALSGLIGADGSLFLIPVVDPSISPAICTSVIIAIGKWAFENGLYSTGNIICYHPTDGRSDAIVASYGGQLVKSEISKNRYSVWSKH